jgi:hypothetical protein
MGVGLYLPIEDYLLAEGEGPCSHRAEPSSSQDQQAPQDQTNNEETHDAHQVTMTMIKIPQVLLFIHQVMIKIKVKMKIKVKLKFKIKAKLKLKIIAKLKLKIKAKLK